MPILSASIAPWTGVNSDLSSSDIPDGAVTRSLNVRFREGAAEAFLGQVVAYPTTPIQPVNAFPVRIGSLRYWLVLGLQKAYCVTGTPAVYTDITRASGNYSANLDQRWNGGVLNGAPVVNNGVDPPQMWAPVATTTKLDTLSAWPANTTCRVIRPFGSVLVALDITEASGRKPHRVKWSHPADPGSLPVTWDPADATKLAGQQDLPGAGFVVDGLPLRDSFIIYKENSTVRMSFIGAPYVYSFTEIFSSSGILAPGCVVEVEGSHVVLTNNDVIIHDGNSVRSIVDKATRRTLFQSINQDRYSRCYLTKSVYFNEVWICFPELGKDVPTKALVYNYKDNTLAWRELDSFVSGNTGQVDDALSQIWDGDTQVWNSDLSSWDENEFGAQLERTMFCSLTKGLVLVDSTTQFYGTKIKTLMERTGLAMGTPNTVKTFSRLRMRVKAPTDAVLMVQVGGQLVRDGNIFWSPPKAFLCNTDTGIDAMATGRFLSYRITSETDASWRLEGAEAEFVPRGRF